MENINTIQDFLDLDEKKDLLRFLTAGSVDDGKSTLIGRLLFDSKKLYEDQLDTLKKDSAREGHAGGEIDYALLLDGLKAEREQGITIDVAYRYFSTSKRKFIIADTPGHEQYTRNMITGGSTANLAIVLLDAQKGVITQTRRHTYLISLLGIKHVVLAVNKMDLVDYSEERFDEICTEYRAFITQLAIPDVDFIPLSALKGDNVVELSDKTPWYHGRSVLEFLETVHIHSDNNYKDFRFPVQYVIRPDLEFRGFAGKISSGCVRVGDSVLALPSGKSSRIKQIITYDGSMDEAFTPKGVVLTLEDEIDISRGEMIVHNENLPRNDRHFEAMLVWMNEEPLDLTTQFYIKHTTHTTRARIEQIRYKVDVNTLERSSVENLELNAIGKVVITASKPLFFDPYDKNRQTGSFILIDPLTNNTNGVGMIIDKLDRKEISGGISPEDKVKIERGQGLVDKSEYRGRYNQLGVTLWVTGLHGSGKNNLAYSLERKLFDMGATVVLIDGFTIRSGLSKELDFSPSDRSEHLRRVAHLSKILNDQGIITICSFISPGAEERKQVEEIIGTDRFRVIFMDAKLEFCRAFKPQLYKLYDEGKITGLPGIDIPYEKPVNPAVHCKPETAYMEEVISYLSDEKIFPAG
ncbi:MAG: sulfate adenylyltransferase subunit CysN [Bacteroidetes bacterium]|nr:sulfate adenylyltransferase subunit CysN [Bacteroidota bacterium]